MFFLLYMSVTNVDFLCCPHLEFPKCPLPVLLGVAGCCVSLPIGLSPRSIHVVASGLMGPGCGTECGGGFGINGSLDELMNVLKKNTSLGPSKRTIDYRVCLMPASNPSV